MKTEKGCFEQNKASNEASSKASSELIAASLAEQKAMLGGDSNPVNI